MAGYKVTPELQGDPALKDKKEELVTVVLRAESVLLVQKGQKVKEALQGIMELTGLLVLKVLRGISVSVLWTDIVRAGVAALSYSLLFNDRNRILNLSTPSATIVNFAVIKVKLIK